MLLEQVVGLGEVLGCGGAPEPGEAVEPISQVTSRAFSQVDVQVVFMASSRAVSQVDVQVVSRVVFLAYEGFQIGVFAARLDTGVREPLLASTFVAG